MEVVWKKMAASKKSVGSILMDQSMVAGIGNIYRAEILFKVRAPTAQRPSRQLKLEMQHRCRKSINLLGCLKQGRWLRTKCTAKRSNMACLLSSPCGKQWDCIHRLKRCRAVQRLVFPASSASTYASRIDFL